MPRIKMFIRPHACALEEVMSLAEEFDAILNRTTLGSQKAGGVQEAVDGGTAKM